MTNILKLETRPESISLFADSSRGIYIPQHFGESAIDQWTISAEDREILVAGPEHDLYWEAWDDTTQNCELIAEHNGNQYTFRLLIGENGDLFIYCDELMTEEEKSDFFGNF